MTESGDALFSADVQERNVDEVVEASSRDEGLGTYAVVPTCRSNILEWLSAGLILPRPAFRKYYEDALAVRPDLVPVVHAPLGGELLDVENADRGNFPVLMELDPAAVHWADDQEVFGFVGPVSLSMARAIHFRDEDELQEFAAREFDNVRREALPSKSSPHLFTGVLAPTRTQLAEALHGVAPVDTAVSYDLADGLAGAKLLGIHAAAASEDHLRWFARRALGECEKRPPRKKLSSAEEWLVISDALASYEPAKNAVFDERVFLAAASVFLVQDRRDAWDPARVLDQIDVVLASDEQLSDAERARWIKTRDKITAILRGDDFFGGFTDDKPGTEKALLLALIRDTPLEILGGRDDAARAAPSDITLAAVLAGLRHGRKAVSVKLRPDPLDAMLASRELDDLCGVTTPVAIDVSTTGAGADRRIVLTLDGVEALAAEPPAPSSLELFEQLDLADPLVEKLLLTIADERGWMSVARTKIRITGPFDVRPVRGGTEVLADGAVVVERELLAAEMRLAVTAGDDDQLRERLSSALAPAVATSDSPATVREWPSDS